MADEANLDQFEAVLAEAAPRFDPLAQADRVLDNTAFYDFSFYEFLFPTETGYQGGLSEQALATLDDFQVEGGAQLASLMLEVLVRVEQVVRYEVRRLRRRDWAEGEVIQDLLEDFYLFRSSTLPGVLAAYETEIDDGLGGLFLEFLAEAIASYLRSHIYQAYPNFYAFWSTWSIYFEREYDLWHEAVQPPVEVSPTTPAREPLPSGPGTIDDDPSVEAAERAREKNPDIKLP